MATRRVLAIGHDWRIRRLIQANLEAFGLEVRGAVDVSQIPDLLDDGLPDLILLDIDLPDREVVRQLDNLKAELSRQVPIIAISAEPPSHDTRWDAYTFSYLLKPFAIPTLLQEVWQALGDMPMEKGVAVEER